MKTKKADKASLLYRIGAFCAHRHRLMLVVWICIAVVIVAAALGFGGKESNDFTLPGTESQQAQDLLTSSFKLYSGTQAQVVFESNLSNPRFAGTPENSLANLELKAQLEQALAEVAKLPHVVKVGDPYTLDDASLSENLDAAFAAVFYDESSFTLGTEAVDKLEAAIDPYRSDELTIELGGELVEENADLSAGTAEIIGLVAALVILLVALGSAVAMGLPIVSALVAVGLGLQLILILAAFMKVPPVANEVSTMIGLGVGIDYGLFVVSRYKEFVAGGVDPVDAAGRSVATSGRAVLIAGTTVIVALLGLLVFAVPIVNALAFAVVIMVVVAISTALTLLPTILGFIGTNIDKGALGFVHHEWRPGTEPAGLRWARIVTNRAGFFTVAGVIVLLIIAIPALDIKLGPTDSADDPKTTTVYKSFEIMKSAFGPGSNGPILIAVEIPNPGSSQTQADMTKIVNDLKSTNGVYVVTNPTYNSDKSVAVIQVIPTTGPKDPATSTLVETIRDNVLPKATRGTDLTALTTGLTAAFVDLDDRIAQRLLLFIALVVLLSFVVLGTVFRSILVPTKAAILNLLAIAATYGFVVAIFQWGWGASLFGVEPAPVISFVPPMMFAVLFGLSMDYEVYIVSRIQECWLKMNDAELAVTHGTGSAARMVVAAALIMISVFLAFVQIDDTIVKMFGLGLAAAIVFDAFINRMIIVPAAMKLMGKSAWWLPRWLDKLLPEISAEGGPSQRGEPIDDDDDTGEGTPEGPSGGGAMPGAPDSGPSPGDPVPEPAGVS